eukprot:8342219-Pyramimonas_sp.AAC.1
MEAGTSLSDVGESVESGSGQWSMQPHVGRGARSPASLSKSRASTEEAVHDIIDIVEALRVSQSVRQAALLQEAVARQQVSEANRRTKSFMLTQVPPAPRPSLPKTKPSP